MAFTCNYVTCLGAYDWTPLPDARSPLNQHSRPTCTVVAKPKQSTNTVSNSIEMENSPFGRLAPELRNQICELVVSEGMPISTSQCINTCKPCGKVWTSRTSYQRPQCLALTETCKQMRNNQNFHSSHTLRESSDRCGTSVPSLSSTQSVL